MKLTFNLQPLIAAIDLMQPAKKGVFSMTLQASSIDKIAIELAHGKDVELKDVAIESGLLSYQGHHVSLYIKANGTNARFHISDCLTLKNMRESGRFERYVVTNNISGEFLVDTELGEISARLNVCQNCLRKLNYKGCNTTANIKQIVAEFNMAEFFATYSSFFHQLPARIAETAQSGYVTEWAKISSQYRVEKNLTCENCKVNMRSHRNLLHVHHIDGVKTNNKPNNLIALCLDCHSKQPMHQHMGLTHAERQTINRLRNEQGLLDEVYDWQKLFALADPGVHGVLHACRSIGVKPPTISYPITNSKGDALARLELAWPKHNFGVAIAPDDLKEALKNNWNVIGIDEFLECYKTKAGNLRY